MLSSSSSSAPAPGTSAAPTTEDWHEWLDSDWEDDEKKLKWTPGEKKGKS